MVTLTKSDSIREKLTGRKSQRKQFLTSKLIVTVEVAKQIRIENGLFIKPLNRTTDSKQLLDKRKEIFEFEESKWKTIETFWRDAKSKDLIELVKLDTIPY